MMIELGKLFTENDFKNAVKIIKKHGDGLAGVESLEKEVVIPRMEHINRVTNQENSSRYFAYALRYAITGGR